MGVVDASVSKNIYVFITRGVAGATTDAIGIASNFMQAVVHLIHQDYLL